MTALSGKPLRVRSIFGRELAEPAGNGLAAAATQAATKAEFQDFRNISQITKGEAPKQQEESAGGVEI